MKGAAARRWRNVTCAAFVTAAALPALTADGSPGPAGEALAEGTDVAQMSAAECGRCHEAHLEDHARSAHAAAWDDPLFQREWSDDPEAYCLPCHSPRTSSPAREPALASAGVDCVTCHVSRDTVLATYVSGEAPHASATSAALAGVELCARCHQVDVPSQPGVALQNTLEEWHSVAGAGPCQSCHMEVVDGRHRHDVPGSRDQALLSRALSVRVRASRDGWDTRVDFTLEAADVGHAVPTGDVFRRLVVRAWDDSAPQRGRSVELGRSVPDERGNPEVDERVPPPGAGARAVTLRLSGRVEDVRWSVELWRVPRDRAARTGLDDAALHRVIESGAVTLRRR